MVSSQMVLAGGNNITLSQSVNGQSATITISGANSGTTAFSAGVSTLGNTAGTTGLVSNQLVLVGGNNITLSQSTNANSATISINATAVVPTLSIWQNQIGTATFTLSVRTEEFVLMMLDPKNDVFPGNMTVSTAYFKVSVSTNTSFSSQLTKANSETLRLGIYTRNASTLSILNSVSTSWGFTANVSNTAFLQGIRWITINSSQWSSSPVFSNTDYYLGYIFNSSGADISYDLLGFQYIDNAQLSGTVGVNVTSGNTSMGQIPFAGASVATLANTDPLPTNIQLSELRKVSNEVVLIPHIVFMNISSNF